MSNQPKLVPQLRFPGFDGEWEERRLGDVCDFRNGKPHEGAIEESGKYVVINSKFISTNGRVAKYSNKAISPLYVNDIVMVMSDVPNGKAIAKCFLVDINDTYTLNQRICALTPKNSISKFLLYQINRHQYYLKFDNGVGQTNLRKDDVLCCPILISHRPEQQKIADVLSAVDDKITQLGQQINQAKTFKKGLMQQLFV